MQAVRSIEQVNEQTLTLELPEFLRNKRVEVIILPLDDQPQSKSSRKRKPSPLLAVTRITGEILAPACPPEDWEALR